MKRPNKVLRDWLTGLAVVATILTVLVTGMDAWERVGSIPQLEQKAVEIRLKNDFFAQVSRPGTATDSFEAGFMAYVQEQSVEKEKVRNIGSTKLITTNNVTYRYTGVLPAYASQGYLFATYDNGKAPGREISSSLDDFRRSGLAGVIKPLPTVPTRRQAWAEVWQSCLPFWYVALVLSVLAVGYPSLIAISNFNYLLHNPAVRDVIRRHEDSIRRAKLALETFKSKKGLAERTAEEQATVTNVQERITFLEQELFCLRNPGELPPPATAAAALSLAVQVANGSPDTTLLQARDGEYDRTEPVAEPTTDDLLAKLG